MTINAWTHRTISGPVVSSLEEDSSRLVPRTELTMFDQRYASINLRKSFVFRTLLHTRNNFVGRFARGNRRHQTRASHLRQTIRESGSLPSLRSRGYCRHDAESAVERDLVLRLASVVWRLRRATGTRTDNSSAPIRKRILPTTSCVWRPADFRPRSPQPLRTYAVRQARQIVLTLESLRHGKRQPIRLNPSIVILSTRFDTSKRP